MKRSQQASPSSIPSSSSFMSVLDALALEAAGSRAGLGQEDTTSLLIAEQSVMYTATTSLAAVSTASSTSSDANPISAFLSSTTPEEGISLSLGLGGSPPSSSSSSSSSSVSSSSTPTLGPSSTSPVATAPNSNTKHVFAHFMVGIVSTYVASDWQADMQLAKSKGITGFALNIGVDSYTQAQLDLAYAAAQNVGFNVFISFDFNWYQVSDVSGVATMLKRYVAQPAQMLVDGRPFVSSFIGDGFDWSAVADQVGRELYAVPYWAPTQSNADNAGLAGLFSWDAWPGQLGNVPVLAKMSTTQDDLYLAVTQNANKTYMAPVSPWFSTHFGNQVSYSKNWVFYSETLWKTRWDQILSMSDQLDFVEIVTWNDYGESHYIGPYNTPHTDDGSSKWAAGLDHSAMLELAVPYIEAFKTGASAPVIKDEMLVYWYRPHLKDASCDNTDVCGSKPTGWSFLDDAVFVAAATQSGGTVTVTSGSNAPVTSSVAAGIQVFQVPMGVGAQSFKLTTSTGKSGTATSNVTISADCWNGIYNFNYHSGLILPVASPE